MITKSTIDVRTIPGPRRHPLVFRTFETLIPGEALELVNDHDPFPLRDQFNFMKRGQFSFTADLGATDISPIVCSRATTELAAAL